MNDCRRLGRIQNSAYRPAPLLTALHLAEITKRRVSLLWQTVKVYLSALCAERTERIASPTAAAEHRTLSQEITRILVEAVHGKGLPAGSVDRRNNTTVPDSARPIRRHAAEQRIFRSYRRREKNKE